MLMVIYMEGCSKILCGVKSSLFILLIFFSSHNFIAYTQECPSETIITSDITADTIWDVCGSPYIIGANVKVYSGVTLRVNEGVVVKFAGNYTLTVDGTLIANGVTFTSGKETTNKGDYNGIKFTPSSSGGVIQNCIIEFSTTAIYCESASPLITGNTIKNTYYGIKISGGSTATISHNTFESGMSECISGDAGSNGFISPTIQNNTFNNCSTGIKIFGRTSEYISEPVIGNNNFNECSSSCIYYFGNVRGEIKENNFSKSVKSGSAIYLLGVGSTGLREKGPLPVINYNNIEGFQQKISASGYSSTNYPEPSDIKINARENWFGSTDTFQISGAIIDYSDNSISGPVVDWSDFLDGPYPSGNPVRMFTLAASRLP